MAVCALMEACRTETWMMCSGCLLFKPEDNVVIGSPEPVDSGPEVDESAVPSHEDTIKLKHLVLDRCRLEV